MLLNGILLLALLSPQSGASVKGEETIRGALYDGGVKDLTKLPFQQLLTQIGTNPQAKQAVEAKLSALETSGDPASLRQAVEGYTALNQPEKAAAAARKLIDSGARDAWLFSIAMKGTKDPQEKAELAAGAKKLIDAGSSDPDLMKDYGVIVANAKLASGKYTGAATAQPASFKTASFAVPQNVQPKPNERKVTDQELKHFVKRMNECVTDPKCKEVIRAVLEKEKGIAVEDVQRNMEVLAANDPNKVNSDVRAEKGPSTVIVVVAAPQAVDPKGSKKSQLAALSDIMKRVEILKKDEDANPAWLEYAGLLYGAMTFLNFEAAGEPTDSSGLGQYYKAISFTWAGDNASYALNPMEYSDPSARWYASKGASHAKQENRTGTAELWWFAADKFSLSGSQASIPAPAGLPQSLDAASKASKADLNLK